MFPFSCILEGNSCYIYHLPNSSRHNPNKNLDVTTSAADTQPVGLEANLREGRQTHPVLCFF